MTGKPRRRRSTLKCRSSSWRFLSPAGVKLSYISLISALADQTQYHYYSYTAVSISAICRCWWFSRARSLFGGAKNPSPSDRTPDPRNSRVSRRVSSQYCGTGADLRRVPSIPGFGFSYNPERRGFEYPQIAESFNNLMIALGYNTYVAQGGDIGSFISCQLGQMYPESCRAVLVNMLAAPPPKFTKSPLAWAKWKTAPQLFYSRFEMENLARTAWFFGGEAGYQVGISDCHYIVRSDVPVGYTRNEAPESQLWTVGFAPCTHGLD